jgi:hypothetical protein
MVGAGHEGGEGGRLWTGASSCTRGARSRARSHDHKVNVIQTIIWRKETARAAIAIAIGAAV